MEGLVVIARAHRDARLVLGFGLFQQRSLLVDDALRLGRGVGAEAGEGRSGRAARIDDHGFGAGMDAPAKQAGRDFGGAAHVAQLRKPGFALTLAVGGRGRHAARFAR
jgi:hypothetical protein